jgi:hypothetical protein
MGSCPYLQFFQLCTPQNTVLQISSFCTPIEYIIVYIWDFFINFLKLEHAAPELQNAITFLFLLFTLKSSFFGE